LLHLLRQRVPGRIRRLQVVRQAFNEHHQPGQQAAEGDRPRDGQEIATAVPPQFLA
jgi:hypothetical protein